MRNKIDEFLFYLGIIYDIGMLQRNYIKTISRVTRARHTPFGAAGASGETLQETERGAWVTHCRPGCGERPSTRCRGNRGRAGPRLVGRSARAKRRGGGLAAKASSRQVETSGDGDGPIPMARRGARGTGALKGGRARLLSLRRTRRRGREKPREGRRGSVASCSRPFSRTRCCSCPH